MGIRPYKIGFDFGDTIAAADNQIGQRLRMSDDPNFLNRPAVPNAFESIKKLVELFGPDNAFIVSRCSEAGEKKIMAWLYYHSFWEQTGMKRENIRFCRERNQKGAICAERGITHFVDDRLECLVGMDTVPHRCRLSNEPPDKEIPYFEAPTFGHYKPQSGNTMPILAGKSWPEVHDYIVRFSMNP